MAKYYEGDLVRVEGENGRIVKVYETATGTWYDIETDDEVFHSAEGDISRPPVKKTRMEWNLKFPFRTMWLSCGFTQKGRKSPSIMGTFSTPDMLGPCRQYLMRSSARGTV